MLKHISDGLRKVLRSVVYSKSPPLCESVISYAPSRNWDVISLHDEFTLHFQIPSYLREPHPRIAQRYDTNSRLGFNGQYLIPIPGARVRGAVGFVILPEGAFVVEGNWRTANVFRHPLYKTRRSFCKRELKGDWYSIISYWSGNYHHWLWDDLPRLITALPHLPKDTRFLVAEPLMDFQKDSLAALGIGFDRLLLQKNGDESIAEKLWFATPLGHSEWAATAPDVAAKLREVLIAAYGDPTVLPSKRIYISRAQAKSRRLLNEAELLPEMCRFGFEIVHTEGLSLPEQVRLFQSAKVVMSIHGAGLSNMVFCQSGALILELHMNDSSSARTHYWTMSQILGHQYRCLVGGSPLQENQNSLDPDFCVEKDKFVEFLVEPEGRSF